MYFCPFVVTTDGVVGERGNELIQKLAKAIAHKWRINLSRAVTYVRIRVAIALARGCSACIRTPHYRKGMGSGGAAEAGGAFAWRNPGVGHGVFRAAGRQRHGGVGGR